MVRNSFKSSFRSNSEPEGKGFVVFRPKKVEFKKGTMISWKGSVHFEGKSISVSFLTSTDGKVFEKPDSKNAGKVVTVGSTALFNNDSAGSGKY